MFFIFFWRNQWYSLPVARTILIVREPEILLIILVKKQKKSKGVFLPNTSDVCWKSRKSNMTPDRRGGVIKKLIIAKNRNFFAKVTEFWFLRNFITNPVSCKSIWGRWFQKKLFIWPLEAICDLYGALKCKKFQKNSIFSVIGGSKIEPDHQKSERFC